jgi:hypothetical protein
MDGDGRDELVVIMAGRASWKGHNLALEGKVHAVARGDIGQDGKEEALIATGAGKGFPSAAARLWKLGADGPEMLWEQRRGRNRVTDVRVHQGEVFLTVFSGGKTLTGGWVRQGALERVTRTQMGLSQVPLGASRVAVGRLYGDEPRSDGDLRILSPGVEDQILPTLRGVRALAASDLDGDGAVDLLAADGWHFKYGTHARARLVLYLGPDFTDRRIVADFPEEYTINRIEVVPDGGAGIPRILVTGTQNVHLLHMDTMGWQTRILGPTTEADRAILWSEGEHRFAVWSGSPATVVPLDE